MAECGGLEKRSKHPIFPSKFTLFEHFSMSPFAPLYGNGGFVGVDR